MGDNASTGRPLTDKEHWRSVWDGIEASAGEQLVFEDRTFDEILPKYLPVSSHLRSIELGCFPGTYMAYLHRRFGYKVSGLDFQDHLESIRPGLAKLGVTPERLIHADFLKDDIDGTWDVVSSFGLVEHFEDTDLVVERHCRLVAPGGYIVIELPHFGGAQYLLHRVFDERNLSVHNVDSMRPEIYERALRRRGFRILTCDYYRTFDFWVGSDKNPLVERRAISLRAAYLASRVTKKILRMTHLEHVPNRAFSPYIVVVAKRD